MKDKIKPQSGQALILIALGIAGLVGITALAIDGGNAFSERRRAQNAADTASLAGALEKTEDMSIGQNGNWILSPDSDNIDGQQRAYEMALANGYNNDHTTNEVIVSDLSVGPGADCKGATDGPYWHNNKYVQVLIRINVDTYFGSVVGIDQLHSCVEAIALADPPYADTFLDGNSIIALSPHDCKALKYQGNVDSILIDGGIFVNSDCQPDAFSNSSTSAILNAPSITAVGGIDTSGMTFTGTSYPNTLPQSPYPPKFTMPDPDCGTQQATQQGMWLSPGKYTGNFFPPAGVTNLEPGLYCVYAANGFIIGQSDSLKGIGVTIAVMEGKISWTGSDLGIQLSAPFKPEVCKNIPPPENVDCNNKYYGLLIFKPMANTEPITWNGSSNWDLTGTVLAPSSDFKITGTEDGFSLKTQIIGYTITMLGDGEINIVYDGDLTWKGPESGSIALSK